MKKTIIGIIIACISLTSFSQKESGSKVKWYTIEEAEKLAKTNPKKIFIDVYTNWCGWCKVMDKNTFTHPLIAEYLNKHFYPVKLNAETQDTINFAGNKFINEGSGYRSTHQLAIALLQGRLSYPSIAYMDENIQLLAAVPGYYTPARLEPVLHYFANETYKTTKWEDFQASFKGEIKE